MEVKNLFKEERNYELFLEKYYRHIYAVAETFAYCLMPNHFHLMIRIRRIEDLTGFENLSGLIKMRQHLFTEILYK
jgi:REP element-mobilizing transposase RayT